MNGIAFALLWLFIFCVPWEDEVAIAGQLAMSHLVGVAAALAGILACLCSRRIRRPAPAHYLAAAFVIWSALSYSWTIAPAMTTERTGSYVQLLLMIWLVWEFARDDERQLSLVAAYVMGGWVASLSTLYNFVTGTGDNVGFADGRYAAEGANENELGITLAISLAMAGYLMARNKAPRFLWFAYVPVCLLSLLLTGSRGSFIAVLIAVLVFPLTMGSYSSAEKKIGGIALILATAIGLAFVPRTTWERIGTIGSEISQGTLTKRTDIWRAGMDVYRDHPFLGVGAGAYGPSVYKQLDIDYVAHNSYLSVLVELGVVGFILFLTLLAALMRSAFLMPGNAKRTWIVLLLTWGVAVMAATWEHRKSTWFLFGLLMAQSAALSSSRLRKRQHVGDASVNGDVLASARERRLDIPPGAVAH
jgi:O-antigen ligase